MSFLICREQPVGFGVTAVCLHFSLKSAGPSNQLWSTSAKLDWKIFKLFKVAVLFVKMSLDDTHH